MKRLPAQAPPAQVTLRAHRPAPAKVELVPQPLVLRVARTTLSIGVFWGVIPFLMWVPPHVPWVLGAFVAGAYLAYRSWTGRYQIRSFTGTCPRCGRALRLRPGVRIDLPHTLSCYGCHFEPQLEVALRNPLPVPGVIPSLALAHREPDCPGAWTLRAAKDSVAAVIGCVACGACYPATTEARRAADEENELGRILAVLTEEGRSLS